MLVGWALLSPSFYPWGNLAMESLSALPKACGRNENRSYLFLSPSFWQQPPFSIYFFIWLTLTEVSLYARFSKERQNRHCSYPCEAYEKSKRHKLNNHVNYNVSQDKCLKEYVTCINDSLSLIHIYVYICSIERINIYILYIYLDVG
jgi:hypothetical protein